MREAASPPSAVVGRDPELSELRVGVEALAAGRGGASFVLGPAGSGKTALAQAVAAEARGRGVTVLSGRSWPLDAGLAYAPIIQAVGGWLRSGLDPRRRADLVEGLPELSRLFGELGLSDEVRLGDPALDKTRLFEAVARLLERNADQSPTLLWVDDLHFADEPTIELLGYLVRRLLDAPFALLATARPHATNAAASELLQHAEVAGVARVVRLGPLDQAAVRTLTERILDGEASSELVELVRARTEGVPFFVVALVAALRREGRLIPVGGRFRLGRGAAEEVPAAARALVLDVVRGLDEPRRTLLEALAVGGSEVDFVTLAGACPLERSVLVESLGALRARGIVTESAEPAGRLAYSIAIPLAQEVLYEQLSEPAKRAVHRRFLDAAPADAAPALVARHVRGVGSDIDEPERALTILQAAAERARECYAHEEAARWYAAALALSRARGLDGAVPELLERLGDAWRAVGESAAAVEVWTEAMALRERAADVAAVASLRTRLSVELFDLGRLTESRSILREGIAAIEAGGPSRPLAHLYETSFLLAWRTGELDWIRDKADELIGWPESDAEVAFVVEMARANLHLAEGRFLEAQAAASRAAGKARTVVQRLRVARFRLHAAMASGTADESSLAEYRAVADEAAVPSLEVPASIVRGLQRLHRGDLPGAVEHFDEALDEARFARSVRAIAGAGGFLALTQSLRGRFDEARRALEPARPVVQTRPGDAHMRNTYEMGRAALAIESGDAETALDAAGRMRTVGDELSLEECVRAEAWLVAGRLDEAAQVAESARRRGADVASAVASARRVLGLIARARGDATAARTELEGARRGFEQADMALFAARAGLEIAELADTPVAQSIGAARAAAEVFDRCDATRWAERARALLRRHGEKIVRRGAPRGERPLSARELEVARLAARGLTNAEIGRELFISPHTAATHMKRIFASAGVSNRPALARWLAERGLAGPD